jgi:hypothetical protein
MFSLLLIEKDGTVREKKVKSFDKLYGVCNYRNEEGFEEIHQWKKGPQSYVLYAKRKGKNNCENKYVLPQPLHQELLYGNMCLVKKIDELESLTLEEWTNFLESTIETKHEEKELKKEEYEV